MRRYLKVSKPEIRHSVVSLMDGEFVFTFHSTLRQYRKLTRNCLVQDVEKQEVSIPKIKEIRGKVTNRRPKETREGESAVAIHAKDSQQLKRSHSILEQDFCQAILKRRFSVFKNNSKEGPMDSIGNPLKYLITLSVRIQVHLFCYSQVKLVMSLDELA